MARLTRTEVTHRLGQDPSRWTFLGQCYTPVPGHTRVCAITLKEPTACFTLKPKVGPGRMTVSPESFIYFEHTNPDLYLKLQTGLMFLRLRTQEVAAAVADQERVNRLRAAEKKHHSAMMKAKKRLQAYRKLAPEGNLPESLVALTALMDQAAPKVKESLALWLEQQTTALEAILLPETAATLAQVTVSAAPAVVVLETPSAFAPIPEIEF